MLACTDQQASCHAANSLSGRISRCLGLGMLTCILSGLRNQQQESTLQPCQNLSWV